MKKIILGLVAVFVLFPSFIAAQVMDTSSITRLQNGQIQFAKGELAVNLSDTVSKDFALSAIRNQGYEVISHNIYPSLVFINNSPPDSTLKRLSSFPGIKFRLMGSYQSLRLA